MHDQSKKKDYQGPLYAPWSAVVAGRSVSRELISTPHMSEAFLDSWKLQEKQK